MATRKVQPKVNEFYLCTEYGLVERDAEQDWIATGISLEEAAENYMTTLGEFAIENLVFYKVTQLEVEVARKVVVKEK